MNFLTVESRNVRTFSSIEELGGHIGVEYPWNLLGTVLKELLDNAADAEAKNIKVSINTFKDYFLVKILDDGPGIPREIIEKISPKLYVSTKYLAGTISRGRKGNALTIIAGISNCAGIPMKVETHEFRATISFIEQSRDIVPKIEINLKNTENSDKSYTLIEVAVPVKYEDDSLQYAQEVLFAEILLNPFITWQVFINNKNILEFKALEDKNKFLQNFSQELPHLSVFSMKDFYRKAQKFKNNGIENISVQEWLSKTFYGLSSSKFRRLKRKLPKEDWGEFKDILSKKLKSFKESDAKILYNTLRKFSKPKSSKYIKTIGKDIFKQAISQLTPLTRRLGFIVKDELEYMEIYPARVNWSDAGAPCFKLEVCVAPIDLLSGQEEVFYFLGVNGSCIFPASYSLWDGDNLIPSPKGENSFRKKFLERKSPISAFILLHIITPKDIFPESRKDSISLIDVNCKNQIEKMSGPSEAGKIVERAFNLIKKYRKSINSKNSKKNSVTNFIKENIDEIIRNAQGSAKTRPLLRQGYYAARRMYENTYNEHMTYEAFVKAVKCVEQERRKYLFSRDTRGHVYIPHQEIFEEVDLDIFSRIINKLSWRSFANILYVEKEGFREMIESAQIPEKYDLIVIYGKGFAVEGMSLLIEYLQKWLKERGISKELRVFCLHDADPSGYGIFLDLLRGSWFVERELLNIEFVDLGLTVKQAKEHNLLSENISSGSNKSHQSSNQEIPGFLKQLNSLLDDIKKTLGKEKIPSYFWKDYLFFKNEKKRYELNAFSAGGFLEFLETRLKEYISEKVRPTLLEVEKWFETANGAPLDVLKIKTYHKQFVSVFVEEFLKETKLLDKLENEFMKEIINEEEWSLEKFHQVSSQVSLGDPISWVARIKEYWSNLENNLQTNIRKILQERKKEIVRLLITQLSQLKT